MQQQRQCHAAEFEKLFIFRIGVKLPIASEVCFSVVIGLRRKNHGSSKIKYIIKS
jgi:hypothetical protein